MIASQIDEGIVALLLRMRSGAAPVSLQRLRPLHQTDLQFLRQFWAASAVVKKFAEYVVAHSHEARAELQFRVRQEAGVLRGRLDAVATTRLQRATGNPALLVSHEATRNYESPLNHLVVWVLEEARRLCRQVLGTVARDSAYAHQFGEAARWLEQASRAERIQAAGAEIDLTRRPTSAAIGLGKRSRIALYRLAADALASLQSIERGDEPAVRSLLQETLLAPLETWRRFELFVAIAMGQALARATGETCEISASFASEQGLLMKVGRYCIHWQSKTDYYVEPLLEPSEQCVADILSAIGMRASWDRPDVVITDATAKAVVAVAEVKYFTSTENDGKDAVRAAVDQLVRYVRGYRPGGQWTSLLTHCLAVPVVQAFAIPQPKAEGVPWVFDLKSILAHALDQWSHALIEALPPFQA